MGVDDWEHKYRGRTKPQLSSFLDDEDENVILRMGRSYPDPPSKAVQQNSHRGGLQPHPYPEGYETIDRRRKRVIRDPRGLLDPERDQASGDKASHADLALLQEKRGELFMRQVAEMQEEEERMTSCLRPYKNGLLYKTRMWAKNELDNTLENYVAFKKEQQARFDFDLEGLDGPLYSPGSEGDMDDVAFTAEDPYSDRSRNYCDRYFYPYEGHVGNSQGLREKKCGKSKMGTWATEAMLSPVEEPSDEYVDPMDELQCLVETVSEYLAEKEEEISKYGSLPKSSKSRLSSLGSNRTNSFGDEPKDPQEREPRSQTLPDQNTSSVKNAVSSLFSSITERVGGPKKGSQDPQAPVPQPSQSGLTKLFSFIPKTNTSAPVAVVSPVENSHERSFNSLHQSLRLQHPVSTTPQGQDTRSPQSGRSQSDTNERVPEFEPRSNSTSQNAVLEKLNPLKLFSSGENIKNTSDGFSMLEGKHAYLSSEVTKERSMEYGKMKTLTQEKQFRQKLDEKNSHCHPSLNIRNENVPGPGSVRPDELTQPVNTGFFSPFKKSLSSLITPAGPVQPQATQPLAVYPVFRSTDDPQVKNPPNDPSLGSKLKMPFLSSEDITAHQRPKEQGGILSGLLKFASSEDIGTSAVRTQEPVLPNRTSASVSSTARPENPAVSQESTEKGWFSSMFNSTLAPTNPRDVCSNPQSAQCSLQVAPNQRPAASAAASQTPSQPESQNFFTGLFKASSSDNLNQHSQGGLLSGLLKFGSVSDVSGTSSQQPPQNFPRHSNSQQHVPVQEYTEAEKQRNYIVKKPCQQQQPLDQIQAQPQPQSKGLLSGFLKFSSPESSSQQQPQRFSPPDNGGASSGPSTGSQPSSQEAIHQQTSKPSFTRQQTVPLQRPPTQKGGLLSGLFKFSSADNINASQPPLHHQISSSKSTHEQQRPLKNTDSIENQSQHSSTQKTTRMLSGLFKSDSENLPQQQLKGTEEVHQPNKVASAPEIQTETTGQSRMLSGLFNKLTKSPENTSATSQGPTREHPQQKSREFAVTSQAQKHGLLTQQISQEPVTQEKKPQSAQGGFLTGLFSKNMNHDHASSAKEVQAQRENAEHQSQASKSADLPLAAVKSSSLDWRKDIGQRILPDPFNPGTSPHAMLNAPPSIDCRGLDLRTSATFARSLQNQATYSSVSLGNLSQLYYSGSPQSICPMAFSTGNIQSLLQSQAASSLMNLQSPFSGSGSSLQNQCYVSPYGTSPSYDENQWISQSIFWQQFQNESLNCQLQAGGQEDASALHHSVSNVYQPPNASNQLQGHPEQFGPYHTNVQRTYDVCPKRKLWNSYEDLRNAQYLSSDDGALNLTTNRSNGNDGKWHSVSHGSTYSLNGVSYHEGYYEETPQSLSYSANWQHEANDTVQSNPQHDLVIHRTQFNLSGQVTNLPNELEDSFYLEDTEWYQQWLALLEQGMWWPAEDGDCGYFVYTDHEYIYALLTDAEGEYVYACAPEGEPIGDTQIGGLPSAWLHNEMVCVCGFKIPLYNEDELLWLPGQESCDSQLLNAPLDLSAAYKKGNQIMNLNLEQFSQMFENSFLSQGQHCLDFGSYTLNKIRMDPRHQNYVFEEQCKGVIDLSCHNRDRIGPNWNNHEVKSLLAQKVAVSLNSTPTTTHQNHQLLHGCYQPSQRRRSSTAVTVKHVDDVLEEEWRQRVAPGEGQPNRQVKKISDLISSVVGKPTPSELSKTHTSPGDQVPDKNSKNILSAGFQSLKSKIIKDEPSAVVSQSQSAKQEQKPPAKQTRILPTIPTAAPVSSPIIQSHTTSQKPRLSRQSTMAQQATPPSPQPTVTEASRLTESLTRTTQSEQHKPGKAVDTIPEQPQTGFMSFLKSAVGIEEEKPDVQKGPQPCPPMQSKGGPTGSLPDTTQLNKETTSIPSVFGSISNLFSAEPAPSLKKQMKPSATDGSLTSTSKPKCLQRQQTMDQSGASRPPQSHLPNKTLSQVSSSSTATEPSAEQIKHDTGSKPTSGLLGFSIGEILSGSATATQHSGDRSQTPSAPAPPQEESLGKSILSIFSGTGPSQSSSKTVPVAQDSSTQKVQQPPQQESLGKSLLSMFGGSSPQPAPQTKPAAEAIKQATVPPKDQPSTGFLSMFSGSTTQQSQGQSGSLLGGILPGSSSSAENPVKGLLSMFGDPNPPQSQPSNLRAREAHAVQKDGIKTPTSKPNSLHQAQEQTTSVLGGLIGGFSASNDTPRKSMFSMFSGSGTSESVETGGNANISSSAGAVPSKVNQSPEGSSASPYIVATQEAQPPSLLEISNQALSAQSSDSPRAKVPCEMSSVVHSTSTSSAEVITEPNELNTQSQSHSAAAPKETPSPGFLSMLTGSSSQASGSKIESLSDSPAKGLLSLFSGPSTVEPSPSASAPESAGAKDTPAKGLFSSLGGSTSQSSQQPGHSLLGAVFGGSSQSPSQTGGSLLGGLFGGSAPQPAPEVGPTKLGGSVPHTGVSLLGGLFGGSAPQAASAQSGGSILGGLFGGSNTGPQTSGSFGGIFAANQTSKSSNSGSILGGILGGSSPHSTTELFSGISTDDTLNKSVEPVHGMPVIPASTAAQISNDNKATTALADSSVSVQQLEKPNSDCKTIPALAASQTATGAIISQVKTQEKGYGQPDGAAQLLEENVPKTDFDELQKTDKTEPLHNDSPSKQFDICSETEKNAKRELLSGQPVPKKEQESVGPEETTSVGVPEQQKPPESEKPVIDAAADAVTGFVSSLFKPPTTSNDGHQQQQKTTLFGLGGTSSQATSSQAGTSLLGGIFGGASTETAAPQTGPSLLGGLFKGSTPQSGPSPTAPATGGSILGGMFGGGSTAKTPGPQGGGSLLGGMFGGSVAAPTQPGGSLLGGMFGGGTAQAEGTPTGASVLGGFGGSLFGGLGKQFQQPESTPTDPKPPPSATSQPERKTETQSRKTSASATETSTNSNVDPIPPFINQNHSGSPAACTSVVSEAVSLETTSISASASGLDNKTEDTKKVEEETMQEKPLVIEKDPECKEVDQSVPPACQGSGTTVSPSVNLSSNNTEPTQPKSLFGFLPTQSDAGKSLGSLLSSAMPSAAPSAPTHTEVGSGLLSGLKTLSGGLFQEEKPLSGKQEPSVPSLFGTKISFPWQSEAPKPQASPVVTSQPKTSKPPSGQTHIAQKASASDEQKTEAVGSTDGITNPQIYISTPEVDPSASQTSEEEEKVVETPPVAGSASGVQLDNQSKKELLNEKRLVKA